MKRSICPCGTERRITLDALQRPRLRCPKCEGVATGPRKRAFKQIVDDFGRVSAFVAESEE